MQALENASAFASAYQVGKLEAGARTNLLTQVSKETRESLKEMVRPEKNRSNHTAVVLILCDGFLCINMY